jgi:hypothetical protein
MASSVNHGNSPPYGYSLATQQGPQKQAIFPARRTQDFGRLTTEEKVDILPGSLDEKVLTLRGRDRSQVNDDSTSALSVRIASDL